MTKLNSLKIAAEIAHAFNHGCAPEIKEYASLDELWQAMDAAAQAYNEKRHSDFRWAAAWPWEEDGTLSHITATGRMEVKVNEEFISFHLYSPSFKAGEEAFFHLHVEGGKVQSSEVAPGAEDLVYQKPFRLEHVPVLLHLTSFAQFQEAASPETAYLVTRAALHCTRPDQVEERAPYLQLQRTLDTRYGSLEALINFVPSSHDQYEEEWDNKLYRSRY